MQRKTRVYIASPYSTGDRNYNVRFQAMVFYRLHESGYAPFSPVVGSHFQDMMYAMGYEDWLEHDFEWVKACDCVLRLGGESPGAEREVALAKSRHIPVFFSFNELFAKMPGQMPDHIPCTDQ